MDFIEKVDSFKLLEIFIDNKFNVSITEPSVSIAELSDSIDKPAYPIDKPADSINQSVAPSDELSNLVTEPLNQTEDNRISQIRHFNNQLKCLSIK